MAVGKQSSKDVTVTYDDSAGTPRIITGFVMDLGGAKIVIGMADSLAFGDAWKKFTPNGVREVPQIPVSGDFDTTATTGPHVVLKPVDADAEPTAATRTLVIVFGDGKTFTVETRIADYEVKGQNGGLTQFAATIQPTGSAIWT